jgi:protoporphyrinogen oxidase
MVNKIAIIGGGISGLSSAQCLKNKYQVKVFEKDSKPGGLIKCSRINGNLYHMVGGHVFNSKRKDVLNWFWNFFDKEKEFTKAERNSIVSMTDGKLIPYPIENHAYYYNNEMMKSFISDLIIMAKTRNKEPKNFEEFLRYRFGETLYHEYFEPYNEKIWRRNLRNIPLTWLEGKLPMPTLEEILYNNFKHIEEKTFVHSSFYYPKIGGSQFIVDRLTDGIDIIYNTTIENISKNKDKWVINDEIFDKVIFCGNIKQIPKMLSNIIDIQSFIKPIDRLEYHGTTTVLCNIEKNPYSWIYMPSREHKSHRIICTGNFAASNNANNKLSGTIEFTDSISEKEIMDNLKKIPFSPQYITHQYTKYTYPIQELSTRRMVSELKKILEPNGFFLLGRFAEWEYYNMDAAIGTAIDLCNSKIF